MTKLVITRGLPASGKSSHAKRWVAEAPGRARVNRDDLRAMLFSAAGVLPYEQEQRVSAAQHAQVRALLEAGVSVIVDDTHLRLKYARAWADLAAELGADFEVLDFPIDPYEAVSRDMHRRTLGERGVGWEVIRDLHQKFPHPWPEVTVTEHAAPKLLPYVPNPALSKALIVDIDGTIAHNDGHRGWHDYDKVAGDKPKPFIIAVAKAIADTLDARIVLVSGRSDSCWESTWEWVHEQAGLSPAALYMRREGDHRQDAIVKAELFDAHVRNRWNVLGVLDDRDQVVKMWRALGLECLQVADGAF